MKAIDFFKGIEDENAFCFMSDEHDNFIPSGDPEYCLFCGDVYPFTSYGEELHDINEYCYEVSQIVKERYADALERFKHIDERYERYLNTKSAHIPSKYEIQMGVESNLCSCENILRHAAGHLTVLLYSFLERTIKEVYNSLSEDGLIADATGSQKSCVKLYYFLERIFDEDINKFSEEYPDLFRVLDSVRKFRNETVHGNSDNDNDFAALPDFRLIEFIDKISYLLCVVEQVFRQKYDELKDNKLK